MSWNKNKFLKCGSGILGRVDVSVGPQDNRIHCFSAIVPHQIYPDPIHGFLLTFPEWNVYESRAEKCSKSKLIEQIASGYLDP